MNGVCPPNVMLVKMMSSRPKDWAISKEEARLLELKSMQRASEEIARLRKDLAAVTAEKELWRRRCAEETIAWADEVNANRMRCVSDVGEDNE